MDVEAPAVAHDETIAASPSVHTPSPHQHTPTPNSARHSQQRDSKYAYADEASGSGAHLEKRESGLPSPPLTRVGTNDSVRQRRAGTPEPEPHDEGVVDVTLAADNDWHPLEEASRDITMMDEEGGVDERFLAADNLEKGIPVKRQSDYRITMGTPSPQPWDLVDPPNTDYYSTVGTRRTYDPSPSAVKPRPAVPFSSYYVGPPPVNSAYGTDPMGQIGRHLPREIVRVERDYTGGELPQFTATYPLELEGRITPTQFLETINSINEVLISAYSIRHAALYNVLAVFSLQLSTLILPSHYDKLERIFEHWNKELYNPAGLHLLWPRRVAFLFLEIEYY
ncbi:hypothetical protein PLICRDRAFT_291004 [Plicaturopsis crispa FD-325 SS-3]|nr:hypothetical protein PLICRDRAFT_291004 [Plicaturopsis crispa FD-325 SS-3]